MTGSDVITHTSGVIGRSSVSGAPRFRPQPIGLVLIFGALQRNDTIPGQPGVNSLTVIIPGFLAFGIVAAAYATLAGTIAMLRADGVLKRIRATPLDPGTYLAGHLASVLATSTAITVTTVALGRLVFGISPRPTGALLLVAALALGVVCFASLGLAISAAIPTADAAGPITNGTFVPLSIISGVFSDNLRLPDWIDRIVGALPIRAFSDSLRGAYAASPSVPVHDVVVLAAWALIGIALARKYFRWEP